MRKQRTSAGALVHAVLLLSIPIILNLIISSAGFAGMPVPGQPVPGFVLPRLLDGQSVSLEDLKGKVVLLNIWASWCTSCKEEMEDLMAVQDAYGPRGFALVAVSIDNSPSSALEFIRRLEQKTQRKPRFILLYDKDKTVSRDYRQRSMPTSYLIDRAGRLRKTYLGSFSKRTLVALKAEIEEALK